MALSEEVSHKGLGSPLLAWEAEYLGYPGASKAEATERSALWGYEVTQPGGSRILPEIGH